MSIDDKLNLILNTMTQDKQKTEIDMKDIRTQMGQLATTVSKLEAQAAGKLPSQPLNPRDTVNAIELRSGKQVEKPATSPEPHERDLEKEVDEAAPKKDDSTLDKEIWEIFKKIEVNIPLIEAMRQVPRYAKFLKELCTNKHKLTGNEVMRVGESASAYLQKKLPPKLKDPGSFTIPCTIGKTRFTKALLHFRASISVMPASIYESLKSRSSQKY
ncbi:uncharacterized protein LOC113327602 [Papaver somniferum]|uniref:uncharacterized protein LOC113327602 n=1 Tax=Papaver somniferum TaxID=3469 RepID=UPI000E6FEA11|nr:uncharacterized protein LOC113327602 [Papaver somniferum]